MYGQDILCRILPGTYGHQYRSMFVWDWEHAKMDGASFCETSARKMYLTHTSKNMFFLYIIEILRTLR